MKQKFTMMETTPLMTFLNRMTMLPLMMVKLTTPSETTILPLYGTDLILLFMMMNVITSLRLM